MVIEKKKYLFNNYFSRKKGEKWVQIGVFAETILEAKQSVKEMGYGYLKFECIERCYGRTGKK